MHLAFLQSPFSSYGDFDRSVLRVKCRECRCFFFAARVDGSKRLLRSLSDGMTTQTTFLMRICILSGCCPCQGARRLHFDFMLPALLVKDNEYSVDSKFRLVVKMERITKEIVSDRKQQLNQPQASRQLRFLTS